MALPSLGLNMLPVHFHVPIIILAASATSAGAVGIGIISPPIFPSGIFSLAPIFPSGIFSLAPILVSGIFSLAPPAGFALSSPADAAPARQTTVVIVIAILIKLRIGFPSFVAATYS